MITFELETYKGYKPFNVEVKNVSVIDSVYKNTAWNISTFGNKEYTSIDISTFGYFGRKVNGSVRWFIGNEKVFDGVGWPGTLLEETGTYAIKAEQYRQDGSTIDFCVRFVKVIDKTLENLDITQDTALVLGYGNGYDSGYGWREYRGMPLVNSKGAVVNIKDRQIERLVVIDATTGLPYVVNPHAKGEEPFKDYWDKWLKVGEDINTELRLQEITGTSQHHMLKLSDVFLYFEPYLRELKGQQGYDENGFEDDTEIEPTVTVDRNDLESDSVEKYPIKEEVYFNKVLSAKQLQIGFRTNKSMYKFVRAEVYALPYDRALMPDMVRPEQRSWQEELNNLYRWYGRGMKGYDLTLSEKLPLWFSLTSDMSPVGTDGVFTISQDWAINQQHTIFWSNGDDATIEGHNYIDTYNGWYLYSIKSQTVTLKANGKYFDLRLYSSPISDDAFDFYVKQIKNNNYKAVMNG